MRALAIVLMAWLPVSCASVPPPPEPQTAAIDWLIEDLRTLSADDMQGRAPGTEGSAKARAYIVQRFEDIGLETSEQPFTFASKAGASQGVNVVARVEGTGRSRKVLVVMAHYDHLGVMDGQVFNGADDNASGVAALLALAQALADDAPRHDVILAAVDAEEGGSRGARVLLADPPVPLARIALGVNLDMLSRGEALWAAGASHFPWLKPKLEAAARGAPAPLRLGHDSADWGDQDWTGQSDHAAFHERGLPWVYFGVEDHADYHRPTDDFAAIDQDFFRRSTQTVIAAVRALDEGL